MLLIIPSYYPNIIAHDIINPLIASVAIVYKTVNRFAVQIN